MRKVKYKKHKKSNKTSGVGGGMGGISSGGNVGGVNGSGSLGGSKSAMGSTMLDKHMAVAAVAHHSQQQHVQLAGGFLHHHKISSGDPLNSQSTTSHSSHPAHSGHLVNGTILKTALTNPSEVSISSHLPHFSLLPQVSIIVFNSNRITSHRIQR